MSIDLQRLVDALEMALLLGSVASLYFSPKAVRWMIKKAQNLYAVLQALGDLPSALPALNRLTALDKSVQSVLHEVKPNGGGSLRDAVDSISAKQDVVAAGIKSLDRALALQNGVMRAHYDADGMHARFETDSLGRNTWVNRTYLRWVNRSSEQMLGYGWINAVAPAYREHVRDEWELAVSERREFAMRYKLRDDRGVEFEVDCIAVPVIGDTFHLPERWVGHMIRLEEHHA